MGGKKNQTQRTKNFVKPSSSGRSAELLGGEVNSFIGFSTLKDNTLTPHSVFQNVTADVLDPNIDPNIQVVLKKMTKKDATTKHKALLEFVTVCQTFKAEDLNPVIPFWIRIYSSLVMDKENRVREGAQQAHRAFITTIGRNLAPYLKKVAPYWLLSQYDTYPPAATAASISFKEAFPSKKMTDVIAFCQEELLQYITDNLLHHTAKTLSKPDTASAEDMEAKYERVVTSSLYGYALYLKMLPLEKLEDMTGQNKVIVSSPKFWNFAKSKVAVIRGAWFSALIALCQNAVFLLETVNKNVIDSVFYNLDESDASVLPIVWEAALHVLIAIKNYTGKLNLSKFFNILSQGGQGNASIIYPHLLPVLSSLPSNVVAEKRVFFGKFFSSLLAGSKQTCVTQSLSESEAVALTFVECIKYLIKVNECDNEFCSFLLDDHLLKLMTVTMENPVYRHFRKPFYHSISQLICFFERNILVSCYRIMVDIFWQKVPQICEDNLIASLTDKIKFMHVLNSQQLLCNALKKPNYTRKKNLKVKFSTSDPKEEEQHIENEDEMEKFKVSEQNIISLIEKLAASYLTITRTSENKDIQVLTIKEIWKIVKLVESENLCLCMMSSESEFCITVSHWLKDGDIPVEPLLELIFNALCHLKDETIKEELLNNLMEVRLKEAIIEAVKLTQDGGETAIRQWLLSDVIQNTLCYYVTDLASEDLENSSEVLRYCLSCTTNGDFAVGNIMVASILDTVIDIIQCKTDCCYKRVSLMLDNFFKNDHSSFFHFEFGEKVLTLLNVMFERLLLIDNQDLFAVWKTGLMKMSKIVDSNSNIFGEHASEAARCLISYFDNESEKEMVSLNRTSKMVYHFISAAVSDEKSQEEKVFDVINLSQLFLNTVLDNAMDHSHSKIESICVSAEQVFGFLPYTDITQNNIVCYVGKWNPLIDMNILGYSQSVLFCMKLVYYMLDMGEDPVEKVNNGSEEFKLLITYKDVNILSNYFLKCSYSLTLLKTLSKYYSSAVQYFDSKPFIENLEPILKELVQLLDSPTQVEILELAENNNIQFGGLWGMAINLMRTSFLDIDQNETKLNECSVNMDQKLELQPIQCIRLKIINQKIHSDKDVSYLINMIVAKKAEISGTFDKNVGEFQGEDYFIPAEVARFFTAVINHKVDLITPLAWDFIMIAVASWALSISKTDTYKYYEEFLGFLTAVCDLFITFSKHLITNKESDKLKTLYQEWEDLEMFALGTHQSYSQAWKDLAENCTSTNMLPITIIHVEKLCDVMDHIMSYGTFLPKQPDTSLVLSWINTSGHLIISSCPSVQIIAHKILNHIAPLMLNIDSGIDESCTSELTCNLIKEPFLNTQTVVKMMLQDFKLGVTCSVKPYTDSYTYTTSYMLMWLSLLQMCKLGDSQLRYVYTLWIKENEVLSCLMDNLLRLMPDPVVHLLETNVKKTQDLFSKPPPFTYDAWTSERLGHLCCWAYCSVLRTLPALARQWASNVDTRVTSLIDRLTTLFVSPTLCAEELDYIKTQEKKFNNMKIHTHSATREVIAVYTLEDCATELVIQLTHNHPLSPPKVDVSRAMVSTLKTRAFIMQLTIFLTHQNGSIWDGLILWKSNMDKKFEGVEECYICFSILHNSSHQLPKLSCQTCRKKFHSICLYTWFTTSNKSTCPICRNLF